MGGWAATKQSLQASRAHAHACRFSLSLSPTPPPPRPLHMEARSYTTYLDLKYSGYHKTLMQQ